MNSDLYIERFPEFLLVWPTTDVDLCLKVINENLVKLVAACKTVGCKKVLLEGRVAKRSMSTAEIYDSAASVGRAVLGLKLACVLQNYQVDDRTILFELVGQRNGVMIEFFTDPAKALAWLGVNPVESIGRTA